MPSNSSLAVDAPKQGAATIVLEKAAHCNLCVQNQAQAPRVFYWPKRFFSAKRPAS